MANTVRTQSPHSGATNQNLRAHNLSLALRHILANPGAINRAGIAAQTGISRATMSRLVDELIATGLVEESDDKLSTGGRGRPTSVLSPASGTVIALGLQVNISVLGAYLVDLSGNVLARETLEGDFSGSDPLTILRKLARMGRRVLHAGREEGTVFLGSALALPGLVSGDTLVTAPNLGWKNIPFDELTHPLHDLHVTLIANEADLAAFAVAHPRPAFLRDPHLSSMSPGKLASAAASSSTINRWAELTAGRVKSGIFALNLKETSAPVEHADAWKPLLDSRHYAEQRAWETRLARASLPSLPDTVRRLKMLLPMPVMHWGKP